MNERIKELAQQARKYADHNEEHWKSGPSWDSLFEEKFAELIVRECADIGDLYEGGEYQVRIQILAHFGIEYRKPCKSPYCECDVNKCSHPGFYDARGES